jgi:hypothetical protein
MYVISAYLCTGVSARRESKYETCHDTFTSLIRGKTCSNLRGFVLEHSLRQRVIRYKFAVLYGLGRRLLHMLINIIILTY